jgi:hypothetical protein
LLLGDQLVSNELLKTIQEKPSSVKKHDEALKIFERYGLRAHSQVLALLGYKVKWSGLAPENAEILKAYMNRVHLIRMARLACPDAGLCLCLPHL